MGFLDQISKSITQGVDRAKFEAEKFQKTTRLQGEVNEFRRQMDAKLMELGQRAYDLQRAGQINAPSVVELSAAIDQLRSVVVVKEEELKLSQNDIFIEPAADASSAPAQQVPISYETPTQPQRPATPPAAAQPPGATTKSCGSCGFQMPSSAMFCPNCGARTA